MTTIKICWIGFNVNLVLETVWWFKIEKFNYLNCSIIWFDLISYKKCWIRIEIWFGLLNKIFNLFIWIYLRKIIELKKVNSVHNSITETFSSVWLCLPASSSSKKGRVLTFFWLIDATGGVSRSIITSNRSAYIVQLVWIVWHHIGLYYKTFYGGIWFRAIIS